LEKAIQRLEGVDKVRVRMDPVRVDVTPRAGEWVQAARLRSAVKAAGFKSGEIRLTIRGLLTEWHGAPAVRLANSERIVVLQALPEAPEAYERARRELPTAAGKTVEVEGQHMDSTGDKTAPTALRLRRLEMSG
jgi:hypothetical protein